MVPSLSFSLFKGVSDMKFLTYALFVLLLIFSGCDLDDYIFNEKQITQYNLPNNTIPDSLLEQVTFNSEGNKLYGYWVKSKNGNAGITILYCHGNKHNIDEYWDRVIILHEIGVNVFIFDYRGFGLSAGTSSEKGLYKDGESALNVVLNSYHVHPDSLCLYGYSLGNVVSIYLAAEKVNPLCLIAEAPFASANSLTQGSLILDIPALWLTTGEFDNVVKIKQIKTPFLLLHGEDDDFVRFRDNVKVVYENAPSPKSLKIVPGAKHNDIPEKMGIDVYKSLIQDWLEFSK
jgi:fermentation-respiration switch protein FrsA (DUF1100 family)